MSRMRLKAAGAIGVAALAAACAAANVASAGDSVTLLDGSTLRGKITKQTDTSVTVRTRDGMEVTFPLERVHAVTTGSGRRVVNEMKPSAPPKKPLPAGPAEAARGSRRKKPRVGDPGSVFDPSKYDGRFPDMKEWAKAGVQGGIPARKDTPVAARLGPGDDIQTAVDRVTGRGGGVVLLAAGTYRSEKKLQLKSGVILRGEDKERTILQGFGVNIENAERAGLEDLTIENAPLIRRIYHNGCAVHITRSKNCWIQNCRLLRAGHNTVSVPESTHVTLRDNYTERGSERDGYYYLSGKTEYVLVFNETVKATRHITLQGSKRRAQDGSFYYHGPKYCVILDCDIQTDMNFHTADAGHNLVEGNLIHPSDQHPWPPLETGWAKDHYPPGPKNIVYRNFGGWKGSADLNFGVMSDREGKAIYSLRLRWIPETEGAMYYKLDVEPPKAGTFYPVTGERVDRSKVEMPYAFEERPVGAKRWYFENPRHPETLKDPPWLREE